MEASREIDKLNANWRSSGKPELVTNFGLTWGEVMVGNIGAPWRLNYTAMGDAVNLASRLEKLNPQYGTHILVSGDLHQAAGDAFTWRLLDRLAVRGRQAVVEIYEPLGLTGEEAKVTITLARGYDDLPPLT